MDETRPDTATRISPGLLLVKLVGVLFLSHYPTEFIVEYLLVDVGLVTEVVVEAVFLGLISGGLIWTVVIVPMQRSLRRERAARHDREARLVADAHRQRFEGRLGRGVEMAETEEQVLDVLDRAVASEFGGHPAALLLADSSGGHLMTALDTGTDRSARRCSVVEPRTCPAIRSGNTMAFVDPAAIDACPHLSSAGSDTGALCVPMQAGGRAVGVLHMPSDDDEPVDQAMVTSLVATVGRRIGMLRVVEQTSLRAETDALTGLSNRRAAEDAARALLRTERAAVVLGDLDHFKLLNDTHGHATGDRALRLFADALRSVARPEDVVARYGGEEFLMVLPGADVEQARGVANRLRDHLASRLLEGGVPAFTASFGIVDSTHSRDLSELVHLADMALYRAKRDGRDRAVTVRDVESRSAGSDLAPGWSRAGRRRERPAPSAAGPAEGAEGAESAESAESA